MKEQNRKVDVKPLAGWEWMTGLCSGSRLDEWEREFRRKQTPADGNTGLLEFQRPMPNRRKT